MSNRVLRVLGHGLLNNRLSLLSQTFDLTHILVQLLYLGFLSLQDELLMLYRFVSLC